MAIVRKKIFFILLMGFSGLKSYAQVPDYPLSVGIDLFGGFRNSLEINTLYKPVNAFGINIIAGNQFTTRLDTAYFVNSKNTSVQGYYFKVGPRFIVNDASEREVYFVGVDLIYAHFTHKGQAFIPNYYGAYEETTDQSGGVFGYSITNGATIHFNERIALDLGFRVNAFSIKQTIDPFVNGYPQPGFGRLDAPSSYSNGQAFVWALFSNLKFYF